MKSKEIIINNTWSNLDILKFATNSYLSKRTMIFLCFLIFLIGYLPIYQIIVYRSFPEYAISNLIILFGFPIAYYWATRLNISKILSKCKTLTITDTSLLVDGTQLERIDQVIITTKIILIVNLKSYIIVKLSNESRSEIIDLIRSAGITLIDHPKNFSMFRLFYFNKL